MIHNSHVIDGLKEMGRAIGQRSDLMYFEKEMAWQEIDGQINWEVAKQSKWFGTNGADFTPKLCFEAWQKGRVLIPRRKPDIQKCWKQAGIANRWIMENFK